MSYKIDKYLSLVPYKAPEWAKNLKNIPEKRVVLATLPTPLHKWNIPNVPNGFKLYVKRDDMTGSSLSGNKVRKLEFLFGEAISQGCKSVITCGSIQSNHCRATAVAARELGLDCHLLLRAHETNEKAVTNPGNLLPSMLCNSKMYFIPKASPYLTDIKPKEEALVAKIREETGISAYPIPVGGSNKTGVFGYIKAWEELIHADKIFENFQDIVVSTGSGGTLAGLAIANFLTGQKLKVHAVTVCDNKEYFHGHIKEMLDELGIPDVKAEDIADVIDGYKGAGYGTSTSDDRDMYMKIANTTGIFCDPVYTGKGVKGLLGELENNPNRFKGKNILFIHTGGIYSLYDGTLTEELKEQFQSNTFVWPKYASTYKPLF